MATVIQSIDPKASGSDTDDSDFAASDSYGSDYDSSTSEGSTKKVKSRKIAGVGDEALASGDEGIVEYGRRKQKRKHKKSQGKLKQDGDKAEAEEDESAGEEGVGVRLKRRREGKAERYISCVANPFHVVALEPPKVCSIADRKILFQRDQEEIAWDYRSCHCRHR